MSDRPAYCCGACPAVEPNPEHLDCEACRTGYDCVCPDNPHCPNYQGDPAPQIIRTVEELEALDPDTVVWPRRHYGPYPVGTITPDPLDPDWTPPLPAVVIRDGAGVRAARKALEEA